MELKKAKKADLEEKRGTFFLIGLVIALGFTLILFEWSSKPAKAETLGVVDFGEIEDELIPPTREKEIKPQLPPPMKLAEIINIVDDDVEIENEIEIEASDIDDEPIDIQPFVKAPLKDEVKEEQIFVIAEFPAEFPGGDRALYKYISDHVNYPVVAQENGIQGKVYVKFVVDEKGIVNDATVLRGVDLSLDKEALRVINKLPKFKPARQGGRKVKVYYNAVINFQLQ